MGARASAALYAISVLVRLEKSWKAAIQRLPFSIMLRKIFCPPTLVQRSTGSGKTATSDRSARRPRNVLFPEAMLALHGDHQGAGDGGGSRQDGGVLRH